MLESRLKLWQWNLIQGSVLIFPLQSELGGLGLFVACIGICRLHWRDIFRNPLVWGLGVLTLWLLTITVLSPRPIDSALGIMNFMPFFFMFMNISWAIDRPSQLRRLAWLLVIPSLVVVVMGWGQLFLGWSKPQFLNYLVLWPLVPHGNPPGRMSSVFMYANILGAYLLTVFILNLGLWIDTYRRKELQKGQLGFLTLSLIMNAIGLYLTNSRNAWVLAFLACLCFAFYLGWRTLVGVFVFLGVSVMVSAWGPSPLKEILRRFIPRSIWARLSDEMFQNRPLATLRVTQWQFTLDMTRRHPLTGWGLRSFTPMYQQSWGEWLGHPHSLYLMLMAETGITGLLLFSAWVGWIYVRAIALLRRLQPDEGQLLLFTYMVAFAGCIFFNTVDVTVADGKMNTINWLLLSSIGGMVVEAWRQKVLPHNQHYSPSP
ncbi:MAG: hypothetical protein N5P05_002322 [Chroococcopsis gigantea SAG 12.99]|jgi:O-antigen ligase|nr:O-antigen ligase family protein [Chlorogloea purpurea SAG 13.99]MDV3000716.1 hypothetical protein [Chroococcopsis gigantea SAG 12.99]